jgi:hypothetical protein
MMSGKKGPVAEELVAQSSALRTLVGLGVARADSVDATASGSMERDLGQAFLEASPSQVSVDLTSSALSRDEHKKRRMDLEFEERQLEITVKKARFEQEMENEKLAAEVLAMRRGREVTKEAAEEAAKAAREKAALEEEELREQLRLQQRASTIKASLEALRALRPERGQQALSPRSMMLLEDELRTALLGKERPVGVDAVAQSPLFPRGRAEPDGGHGPRQRLRRGREGGGAAPFRA